MSTDEEIRAVYEDDIGKMSYIVEQKFGKRAFYDNFRGMKIRKNTDIDKTFVVEKKKESR
jgi:hypothetical protein